MSPNSEQANATPADPSAGESISRDSPITSAEQPGDEGGQEGQQERPGGSKTGREAIDQLGGMIKTPAAGAAISGTVVLGAAAVFGVLETTVAAGAAYVAYRLLRRKRSSSE